MDRETISSLIDQAAPELRARGVAALYLFGSQARGDGRAESDIDFAFDVREGSRFSLLDQGGLQIHLEELFGRKVDFVSLDGMRPRMRSRVEQEMVRLL